MPPISQRRRLNADVSRHDEVDAAGRCVDWIEITWSWGSGSFRSGWGGRAVMEYILNYCIYSGLCSRFLHVLRSRIQCGRIVGSQASFVDHCAILLSVSIRAIASESRYLQGSSFWRHYVFDVLGSVFAMSCLIAFLFESLVIILACFKHKRPSFSFVLLLVSAPCDSSQLRDCHLIARRYRKWQADFQHPQLYRQLLYESISLAARTAFSLIEASTSSVHVHICGYYATIPHVLIHNIHAHQQSSLPSNQKASLPRNLQMLCATEMMLFGLLLRKHNLICLTLDTNDCWSILARLHRMTTIMIHFPLPH